MNLLYDKCVNRWGVWEVSFVSEYPELKNPFKHADFSANFTAPSGKEIFIKGFYDGEKTWKIRFCPDESGKYNVKLTFSDTYGNGFSESLEFQVIVSGNKGRLQHNSQYPMFFQTQDGTPAYILGSGMEIHIPRREEYGEPEYYPEGKDPFEEWRFYLDILAEAGFNRLRFFLGWMSFPWEEAYGGKSCGFFKYRDVYAKNTKTGHYDMFVFNTTSWQLLDRVITYAFAKDIFVEIVVFDRCCYESWQGHYRWEYNCYNERNGGPLPEIRDIFRYWREEFSEAHLQAEKSYNGKRAFFDIMEPVGEPENWSFQMWNYCYQKFYVDYLLARTSAYPNIYYEVINEIERPLDKWTIHWFTYLREHDPYGHLITISPIYDKLNKESSKYFDAYQHLPGNDILSLHNKMIPAEIKAVNSVYKELKKPIIYDEVFWVRSNQVHGRAKDLKSYDDERKWFWSNFINGSMTVRVCWQPFEKTSTFEYIKHLKSFMDGIEWWRMVPDVEDVQLEIVNPRDCNLLQFQCRIGDCILAYWIPEGDQPVKQVAVKKLSGNKFRRIRLYNTRTGAWLNTLFDYQEEHQYIFHIPQELDDVVCVME